MEHLPIHYPVLMTIEDTAAYELEEIDRMVDTLKPYWENIARHQVKTKLMEKQGSTSPQESQVKYNSLTLHMNSVQTKLTSSSDKDIPEL